VREKPPDAIGHCRTGLRPPPDEQAQTGRARLPSKGEFRETGDYNGKGNLDAATTPRL
jgi:hypothetical protein